MSVRDLIRMVPGTEVSKNCALALMLLFGNLVPVTC